jgi:hypothetical protein
VRLGRRPAAPGRPLIKPPMSEQAGTVEFMQSDEHKVEDMKMVSSKHATNIAYDDQGRRDQTSEVTADST